MAHRPVHYRLDSGSGFDTRLPKIPGYGIDGVMINIIFIPTTYTIILYVVDILYIKYIIF